MSASVVHCATCGAANPPDATACFACDNPPLATDPQAASAGAPGGSLTSLLAPQTLLRQRYRLLAPIGKGDFGAVYQAEDTELGNRKVAIKEMSQRGLTPEVLQEATQAFGDEARLLEGLTHPHLPRIYEQFSEGGRWYLVMDFIEGETLEARLRRMPGGRLPVQEVLRLGLQLCAVLDYLHTRQPPIIFRDLKPANIMITQHGNLYLIDFGIARYFKPGQDSKAQTTTQSDIYRLGATLHQCLSGSAPSNSPSLFAPLHLAEPEGLETLIMQMLEADATKRPRDAHTIGQELQRMSDTFAARQKHPHASIVSPSPQTSDALGPSSMPLKGAAAHPGASSQGKIVIPSPLRRGLSVKKKMGIASIGGVIALSLVAIVIFRSLSFHQAVVTSQAVPYIQVGLGGTISPNTSSRDTFHVGDTVYVTFVLRDTSLPQVSVRLFLGTTLKQSETVSIGENVDQLFVEVISTPKGTVTGIQVTEETTATQVGTYKWEVDDDQGNAEASITFQVTGKA